MHPWSQKHREARWQCTLRAVLNNHLQLSTILEKFAITATSSIEPDSIEPIAVTANFFKIVESRTTTQGARVTQPPKEQQQQHQ